MSSFSQRVVMISAALLPARVRSRYREQWLGELRDAPGIGLRSSEIAMGSLAFAATFGRTSPASRRPDALTILRRARLAIALAVSAAGLAFGQLADSTWDAQSGTNAVSFAVGLLWTLLTAYAFVAPIVAVITVFATRGMSWWVRGVVIILAGLCALPLELGNDKLIWVNTEGPLFYPLATIVFPTIGLLLAFGALLFRRRRLANSVDVTSRSRAVRIRRGALAAVAVALLVWIGFSGVSTLWDSRLPFRFRFQYGSGITLPELKQVVAINTSIEHSVGASITAWFAIGLIAALAVAVVSWRRQSTLRQTVTVAVVLLGAVLLSFGSLTSYVQLLVGQFEPGPPIDLATEAAQLGLVVALLLVASRQRRSASIARGAGMAGELIGPSRG